MAAARLLFSPAYPLKKRDGVISGKDMVCRTELLSKCKVIVLCPLPQPIDFARSALKARHSTLSIGVKVLVHQV